MKSSAAPPRSLSSYLENWPGAARDASQLGQLAFRPRMFLAGLLIRRRWRLGPRLLIFLLIVILPYSVAALCIRLLALVTLRTWPTLALRKTEQRGHGPGHYLRGKL
jgi:hypothetical protein